MAYTRCRMHGGASTGPRTPEGMERCRKANWRHGVFSAENTLERRLFRLRLRLLRLALDQLGRDLRVILRNRRNWNSRPSEDYPFVIGPLRS